MTTIAVLIGRRVAGNWRLMAALALGFIIAVGLMSATVIYADALDDLGLDFALDRADAEELNLVVYTPSRLSPAELESATVPIEGGMETYVGRHLRGTVRYLRSGTFYPGLGPGVPPDLEDDGRPRSFLQSRTGILDHVAVEGRPPVGQATETEVEVAIGRPTAEEQGYEVGDVIELYPYWDETRPALAATIVGIYDQLDPASDYWTGPSGLFEYQSASWATIPLFVNESALVAGLGAIYLNMPGELYAIGLVDRDGIQASESAAVRGDIARYESHLRETVPGHRLETTLPTLLQDFEDRLFFSRIPLFILIIQIVGIAVYYLVMVASMLVERQSGEIALLKSRGGTTAQVMQVYLVEGLGLALVAVILGPLLASFVVAQMGRTPIFDDLTGGGTLEARITLQAFLVALAGAALALASLLIPAFLATRRTIVHYKQSLGRKDTQPLFFRYYLDLFFVAFLGLLLFQLREQGTLASENIFGDLESDPLLLISPAIFLVTVGVLFLRLFPVLLRGVSYLLGRTGMTAPLVAMWHLVRNPTHYGRLVLLLILATSLGAFAAGFGSTLNTNYGDRAAYESGADVRLASLRPPGPGPQDLYESVAEVPGVQQSAAVLHDNLTFTRSVTNSYSLRVIGIDEYFQEVAFFRDDFAPLSLPELSAAIGAGAFTPPQGSVLPAGHNWLAVSVEADWETLESVGGVEFHAQLRDRSGQVRDLLLASPGWETQGGAMRTYYGVVSTVSGPLNEPLELASVSLRRSLRLGADRASVIFQTVESFQSESGRELLNATEAPPELQGAVVVETFDDPARWEIIDGQLATPLSDEAAGVETEAGAGVQVSWSESISQYAQRGIRAAGAPHGPLPVAASDSFLAAAGLAVGDVFQTYTGVAYIDLEVVTSVTYFPTVADPSSEFFVVADFVRYQHLATRAPGQTSGVTADELWLDVDEAEFDVDLLLPELPSQPQEVILGADVAAGREQDPLTAAGWQGVLAMSFGAVLLLSAVGFVVYSYLSAQERRLEFAILRTLGLTRQQVAGVVAFEQAIVVVVGMVVGSLVGIRLGPILISYLGITETGSEVVPPYQDVTDWVTLLTTYATLVAVFAAATVLIIGLYSRLAIHRVLRLGEL